eukprot:Nk52_evm88s221 gene=Nk52_evmTU88s221
MESSWVKVLETHELFNGGKLGGVSGDGQDHSLREHPRGLMCEHNGCVFIWASPYIYYINLHYMHASGDVKSYQRLVFKPSSLEDVCALSMGINENYIAVIAKHSIDLLQLPTKGKDGQYGNGADEIYIRRQVSVGREYFSLHSSIDIVSAKWHPHSKGGSHLVVLTSDNVLRIYNIENPRKEEASFVADPTSKGRAAGMASMGRFVPSYGADMVSVVEFDFGGKHDWDWFSVYILMDNGDIYVLCPVIPSQATYPSYAIGNLIDSTKEKLAQFIYSDNIFGDETLHEEAEKLANIRLRWLNELLVEYTEGDDTAVDNGYCVVKKNSSSDPPPMLQGPLLLQQSGAEGANGVDVIEEMMESDEACGFLCIPSYPTVLAVAYSSGKVNILLSLETAEARWVDQCEAPWQSPDRYLDSDNEPNIFDVPCLQIYDRVDLSFPYDTSTSSVKFLLTLDSLSSNIFYISHSGGLCGVHLPWLLPMGYYLLNYENKESSTPDLSETVAYDIIISRPLPSSPPACFIGCCVVTDPALGYSLLALNAEGELICVELSMNLAHQWIDESYRKSFANGLSDSHEKLSYGQDSQLKRVLENTPQGCVLDRSANDALNMENCLPEELLQFVIDFVAAEKKSRVKYLLEAKSAIENRGQVVKEVSNYQRDEISKLGALFEQLSSKGNAYSAKLNAVEEKQSLLNTRITLLSQILNDQQTVLSNAEIQYGKELRQVTKAISVLNRQVEELKRKQESYLKTRAQGVAETSGAVDIDSKKISQLRPLLTQLSTLIDAAKKETLSLCKEVGPSMS